MIKTPKAKEYGKRMQVISHMYLNKNAKLFKNTQWEEESWMLIHASAFARAKAFLRTVGKWKEA
jgi:hypothetical protein